MPDASVKFCGRTVELWVWTLRKAGSQSAPKFLGYLGEHCGSPFQDNENKQKAWSRRTTETRQTRGSSSMILFASIFDRTTKVDERMAVVLKFKLKVLQRHEILWNMERPTK